MSIESRLFGRCSPMVTPSREMGAMMYDMVAASKPTSIVDMAVENEVRVDGRVSS